jgi:hypothetical protein
VTSSESSPEITAGVDVSVVGTFKCFEVIFVSANQIGRQRQQFEILSSQRSFLVGAQERLESLGPGAPLMGFTGAI